MNTLTTQQTSYFHNWLTDNQWRQTTTIDSRHTIWYYTKQPQTTNLNIPKQPRADQIAALAITVYKIIKAYENDQQAHNNEQQPQAS